jgi:hypothetical protein
VCEGCAAVSQPTNICPLNSLKQNPFHQPKIPPKKTDAVEDSADEAAALVEALLAHNGLELLYQALARFDEANEDEAAAVNKTLAVFEHLAEV